jgi:two-component system, chemotaxis family, CheB/CheR fusion protein
MTPPESSPDFEALLEYLKRTRGFDFAAYKRSSLTRRILNRMQMVKVESFADYVDYLEVHPNEFALLFNMILINVTSFFRDLTAWEYLTHDVLPRIIKSAAPNGMIRVWSAGTASGEEAYSLAIFLAEELGIEGFRSRVKIYATDVDEEALSQARQGIYSAKAVEEMPVELRDRYFERVGAQHIFHRELRRSVIFGRHDLVQDPPMSRLSLLVCRNTLMYFNNETQGRVLSRFHYALNENGFLFLGKAEMLLTHTNLFLPLDLKRRVFMRAPHSGRTGLPARIESGPEAFEHMMDTARMREIAFEIDPVAQFVVDGGGRLTLANERARALFGIGPSDLGRPFQDLEVSFRPTDLRAAIQEASVERRPAFRQGIAFATQAGEPRYLDIQVIPMLATDGVFLGAKIGFVEVTRYRRLQEELQTSKHELETAYEELQSSNEELETTNEELQSSNEELETTNEELQSTNEELETMNEELQSTNEELETINTELRQRGEDLNHANSLLKSILGGIRVGVAVLDRNLRVMLWNDRAEDLWGLRADEVRDGHFMNLDIGLPVEQLRQNIRACLAGESTQERTILEARDRRGRPIRCEITCAPLLNPEREIRGAIVLMETGDARRPS